MMDLFGPDLTEPQPDPFPIHVFKILRVDEVRPSDMTAEEFFIMDFGFGWRDSVEYEVELIHPEGCGETEDEYCLVGEQYKESGSVQEFLCGWAYPGYTQTFPYVTTYYVRGWTSKHDIPGYPIEYDAGVEVSTQRSDLE